MFDLLAVAMANDAMRRQHQRFEATPGRGLEPSSSSLGRVRVGVARRLRAVADRIEPVGNVADDAEPSTVAIDRRDAA
jgi:hypothetical protein